MSEAAPLGGPAPALSLINGDGCSLPCYLSPLDRLIPSNHLLTFGSLCLRLWLEKVEEGPCSVTSPPQPAASRHGAGHRGTWAVLPAGWQRTREGSPTVQRLHWYLSLNPEPCTELL